jgi:hypothetical protein
LAEDGDVVVDVVVEAEATWMTKALDATPISNVTAIALTIIAMFFLTPYFDIGLTDNIQR